MNTSSFFPRGVGVEKLLFSPVTKVHGPVIASARQRLMRFPLISRPQATYRDPFGCCHGAGLSQFSLGRVSLVRGDHGPAIDLETWIREPLGLGGGFCSLASACSGGALVFVQC